MKDDEEKIRKTKKEKKEYEEEMKGNINTRFYGTNFFEQKTDPSDFFTANSQLNYLV